MTKFRKETDLGPNSIKEWCQELDIKKTETLSQKDELFLRRFIPEEKEIENNPEIKRLLGGWNTAAIMYSRLKKFHTYTVSNAVLVFMGCIMNSPGIAVEYCNYMQYKCWQYGIKHINMDILKKRIFPMGFFSEETLREMWDKQKIIPKDSGSLANMLDHPEFMESIRELKEK